MSLNGFGGTASNDVIQRPSSDQDSHPVNLHLDSHNGDVISGLDSRPVATPVLDDGLVNINDVDPQALLRMIKEGMKPEQIIAVIKNSPKQQVVEAGPADKAFDGMRFEAPDVAMLDTVDPLATESTADIPNNATLEDANSLAETEMPLPPEDLLKNNLAARLALENGKLPEELETQLGEVLEGVEMGDLLDSAELIPNNGKPFYALEEKVYTDGKSARSLTIRVELDEKGSPVLHLNEVQDVNLDAKMERGDIDDFRDIQKSGNGIVVVATNFTSGRTFKLVQANGGKKELYAYEGNQVDALKPINQNDENWVLIDEKNIDLIRQAENGISLNTALMTDQFDELDPAKFVNAVLGEYEKVYNTEDKEDG